MLVPAAFLFFVVSGLPHVFIIVCAGLAMSFAIRKPFKFSDRSIIYSIVASLIIAVLMDMVFPMKQERFFSVGKVFMSHITVPALLYMAVLATFFESSSYTFGLNAAFSMIVIMLAGDFRMSSQPQETSIFTPLLLRKNFNAFFTATVIAFCLSMLYAFSLAGKTFFHARRRGVDIRKGFALTASLVATALLALGAISVLDAYRADLRKLEGYFTRMMRNRSSGNGMLFGDEIDLNATISGSAMKNLNAVMIRVRGREAPGYLRGRAYQYYNNGKWRDTQGPPENMKFELNIGNLAVNAFFFEDETGSSGNRFDILPTSGCRAEYLFYPPAAKRFELVADRLERNPNGMLKPLSWESGAGYSVVMPENLAPEAFQLPEKFVAAAYLNVPRSLQDAVKSLAAEAGLGKAPESLPRDRDKIEKIIACLNEKFSYKLYPEAHERGSDPAANFMANTREGHCELFATTAAMLLRHEGIPSRYVTGFVCSEPHPSGTYFVARAGDAHAWCEAYLRDENRWVLIEPTPDAGFAEASGGWGFWSAWTDLLKLSLQQLVADIRRGYFARAVISFGITFFRLLATLLWHPARGLFFLMALALLFVYFRSRRSKKGGYDIALDKTREAAKTQFNAVISTIAGRTGLRRKPGQTVGEWWDSIRLLHVMPPKVESNFNNIVSLYRETRFSGSPASNSDIACLKSSCSRLRKDLKKAFLAKSADCGKMRRNNDSQDDTMQKTAILP